MFNRVSDYMPYIFTVSYTTVKMGLGWVWAQGILKAARLGAPALGCRLGWPEWSMTRDV